MNRKGVKENKIFLFYGKKQELSVSLLFYHKVLRYYMYVHSPLKTAAIMLMYANQCKFRG